MKKIVYVLAVLAAASTAAVAKDLKQDKKSTAATQMTDAEMDRVTAGFSFFNGNGTQIDNNGRGNAFGIAKGRGASPL
jgi:hypothetical protein